MPFKENQKRIEYAQQYRNTPEAKASKKAYSQTEEAKAKTHRKIVCECGCTVSRHGLMDHNKTIKHITNIQKKNSK